jgi:hypothetical protein
MRETVKTQNWQQLCQRINTLNPATIGLQAGKKKPNITLSL